MAEETRPGIGRKRRARARVVNIAGYAAAQRRPRVAVTGGGGFFGGKLIRTLAARGDWDIVNFDLVPPVDVPPHVTHRFLDLNLPFADLSVYKLLREEKPDAVVHLAQLRSPSRNSTYAHELNSIGALHVLAAAGEARIPRVILGSTTLVYGASGDNPNFLTEEHPLRPDPEDRFVRDFVEAESHARAHMRRHPEARVAVLRFVPLLSPEVRDYRAQLLAAPAGLALMGYDPLLQALDPDDAVEAALRTLDKPDVKGVFNIAPEGVVPLSTARFLFGSLPIPVPHVLAYALIEAAWLAGVGIMPGIHAHYIRYLCVVDNHKARRVLGWEPRKTTLQVMLETARARRGKGRLLDFDKLDEEAVLAAYKYEQRVKPPIAVARETPRRGARGASGAEQVAS